MEAETRKQALKKQDTQNVDRFTRIVFIDMNYWNCFVCLFFFLLLWTNIMTK